MPRTSAAPGVTVTTRVLAILGSFDAGHRAQALSEIADRAGLTLPTAHRLVGELAAGGVLRRASGGHYVIGRRVWELGLLAPVQTGLRDVAAPFLQDLYGATLATVHLAVRDGAGALYLDRISGHASVPVTAFPGALMPMYSTGVGKVLLAHAPDEVQRQVLDGPLERFTPYTIVQPSRLRAQLRRIRQDGHATTAEEMTLGACSLAVPVTVPGARLAGPGDGGARGDRVVAALGLVLPDLRGSGRLVLAMRVAAQGIARGLVLE